MIGPIGHTELFLGTGRQYIPALGEEVYDGPGHFVSYNKDANATQITLTASRMNRWKGTVGTTIWLWGHSRGLINILPPGRGDCTGWIIRSCSARTRKQA